VKLSAAEIQKRLKQVKKFQPKITHGWLARYAKFATSADQGAVLEA
jgi:dihydroxy-acid dehydratase